MGGDGERNIMATQQRTNEKIAKKIHASRVDDANPC